MTRLKLSSVEKTILVLVGIILLAAFAFFFFNPHLLDVFLDEDGPVEWLTVAGLLAGCFLCFYRFAYLLKIKNWWFLTVTLVLGILLFIAAGEEISWGQRILGIKSSEYFLKKFSTFSSKSNLLQAAIHLLLITTAKKRDSPCTTVLYTEINIQRIEVKDLKSID